LVAGAAFWRGSLELRPKAHVARSPVLSLANCAALQSVNGNFWALAAFPVTGLFLTVRWRLPRVRWLFYAYYPIHLLLIWLARIPMANAGYFFFM
jgi:hypothetical protein